MNLLPRMVAFHTPKEGSSDAEWEDGVAFDPGDPRSGVPARIAIADGASMAYAARRWAAELTSAFRLPSTAPAGVDRTALTEWFSERQRAWNEAGDAAQTVLEQLKIAEGSFATFVGCLVRGLDGSRASWEAGALGDAVLFHVRNDAVVSHLPALEADDFGRNPAGVHTRPDALPQMASGLLWGGGALLPNDHLFLATDALADWIVRRATAPATWQFLAAVSHPAEFSRFVTTERAAGEMTDDDVTLLRVFLPSNPPRHLVVCR